MSVWKPCPPGGPNAAPPILFLDRDGVVISNRDYLDDPELVELIPGSAAAMAAATADGYLLVGVSNQSGLGRGYFTTEDLTLVMTRLDEMLAAVGTAFDGFYYCPHEPSAGCRCRKPRPGLLEELGKVRSWNPADCWMVGDKASDVAFGRDQGMGAVLVRTGHGAGQEDEVRDRWADDRRVLVADDLWAAYSLIKRYGDPGAAS